MILPVSSSQPFYRSKLKKSQSFSGGEKPKSTDKLNTLRIGVGSVAAALLGLIIFDYFHDKAKDKKLCQEIDKEMKDIGKSVKDIGSGGLKPIEKELTQEAKKSVKQGLRTIK